MESRGKGSEEAGEEGSPPGIWTYKEFGFCPKGKGFVQQQGTSVHAQNFLCGGLSEAGIT